MARLFRRDAICQAEERNLVRSFVVRQIEVAEETMSESRMQKRSCGSDMAAAIFRNCWMCQPLAGLARNDHQNWRRLRWMMRGMGRSQEGRKVDAGTTVRRSLTKRENNAKSLSGTSR